jgi:hypothetical protein
MLIAPHGCQLEIKATLGHMRSLEIPLVGGLEHGFYDFPHIGNVILPSDEVIVFRGVG